MHRGETKELLLELLNEGVAYTLDIMEWYLSLYHESYRKHRLGLLGIPYKPKKRELAEWYRHKTRAYLLLNRLKRQGLIENKKSGKNSLWILNSKGRTQLKKIREQNAYSLKGTTYKKILSSSTIIVAFDIPEKERRARHWLRGVLQLLGLEMLQKSLWAGKVKLPEEFFQELKAKNIIDCVQIFEVGKTGTLKNIT